MPPELMEAIGMILAGGASAFLGGKNSLNGFKQRVDARFDSVDSRLDRTEGKIDSLIETDGRHETKLQDHGVRISGLEDPVVTVADEEVAPR